MDFLSGQSNIAVGCVLIGAGIEAGVRAVGSSALTRATTTLTQVGKTVAGGVKTTGEILGSTTRVVGNGLVAVGNGTMQVASNAIEKVVETTSEAAKVTVDTAKNLVNKTGAILADTYEKTSEIIAPSIMTDQTIQKVEKYEADVAAIKASSPFLPYPEPIESFERNCCTNPHKDELFFQKWVSDKAGTNLQKIDHLLSHPALADKMNLVSVVLDKFHNNDQAVIDVLEAMIVTLSFPDPTSPRVVNIPINRTPTHSGKILVNGILTSTDDVLMRGIDEYAKHIGEQVTFVCIPSEGFITDAANTWAEKQGSVTLASYVGITTVHDHLAAYPNNSVLIQAFSRGSAVVNSFSQMIPMEDRPRIAIHTFGATEFASDVRGFLDARNYVSWKDPVAMPEYAVRYREYADNHTQIKSRNFELLGLSTNVPVKIAYVETDGWFGMDHSFDDGYLPARDESYKEFLRRTQFSVGCKTGPFKEMKQAPTA